jgi:hypothetical protein
MAVVLILKITKLECELGHGTGHYWSMNSYNGKTQ